MRISFFFPLLIPERWEYGPYIRIRRDPMSWTEVRKLFRLAVYGNETLDLSLENQKWQP